MRNLTLLLLLLAVIGCEAVNPICSENYCVTGEIFPITDLEDDQEFTTLGANITEQEILDLWTTEFGVGFQPVTVTGRIDWDFTSEDWQYRENRITYLKKVTLEIETDEGRFGENRIILVKLNNHTVRRDADFTAHVDFLGTESIRLTQHIGIATFKGDIVGAPTKE